ncbi:hypothetical protein FPE01S_02_02540 [Flavihumibacter petaseus NBRC 106054]|uniref:Uncharacterized protein n=2 Tax=Flavihumibacter TaxID=1004301 RepID=A0A0E9N1D9_9BACT|nr:hypothetical protein FPE01S_02_02540 [Flavihumibacter petaseus NBRC 106054]
MLTACTHRDGFAVTAKVMKVMPGGKDGYTAEIQDADGKTYHAVISRVNMAVAGIYRELKVGEEALFFGDSTQLENGISIRVLKLH